MSRIHVDRPGQVHRTGEGWVWSCWLCPPPRRWIAEPASDYLSGARAAHDHIRTEHADLRRAAA